MKQLAAITKTGGSWPRNSFWARLCLPGTLKRGEKNTHTHKQTNKAYYLRNYYHRYNNRTYRIDDVDWGLNPGTIFSKRTGEKLSYFEYYASAYNRNLN